MSGSAAAAGKGPAQHRTGKTGADAPARDRYWDKLVESTTEMYLMSREDLLDDLQQEREKALKSPDGYKDFKPFVLYGQEAFKKVCSAFNYDPAKDGDEYAFDFHPADLVEAMVILAECTARKDFYFIDKVFKGLQGRCDKLLKVKQKDEDSVEARKERQERIRAYITLFICGLKALVVVEKCIRAYRDHSETPDRPEGEAEEKAAEDIRTKVEKGEAVKIVAEWIADFVEAVATILWNPEDQKRLKEWAEEYKKGEEHLESSRKGLDAAWKKAGVERKTKVDGKPAAEPGMKPTTIKKWVAIIKGIGEVLSAAIEARVAWAEMHPKDIDGTWTVEHLPDGQVQWALDVVQVSKNVFRGKLTGRGRAHPEDRRIRVADWASEEKATVEIRRDPSTPTKLKFTWKPSGKKKQQTFPALGDGFFNGTGQLEEEFDLVNTHHLSCGSSAIGQKPGEKQTVELSRSPQDLKHSFKFAVALLKLGGALWSMVPEKRRNDLLAKVLGKAQHVLQPLMDRIRKISKSLLSDVDISIVPEPKDGGDPVWLLNVTLSTGRRRFKLSASWKILDLLNAAVDLISTPAAPAAGKRSALLPSKLSATAAIREAGEISLGLAEWEGAAIDKKAGEQMKRLDEFLTAVDLRSSLSQWFQAEGLRLRVNLPRVRSGNIGSVASGDVGELLPAVELPIDLYIEDLLDFGTPAGPAGGALPVKLTLTVGLTAATVASKIPQVRAVLFAWDVGWTIGSFVNELPPVQRATTKAADWLGDWTNYKEVDDRFDQIFAAVDRLASLGVVGGMEVAVVEVKGRLFAAEEWALHHGFQMLFRNGRHPSFQRWQEQRARREAEGRAHLTAGPAASQYCWSPGHSLLMAYALGSGAWAPEDIRAQLDDDFKKNLLHPMQRDLLDFYLIPFDDLTFRAAYERMNAAFLDRHKAAFERARDNLGKAASGKRPFPSEDVVVTRWYEFVAGVQHRDHVACMLYQAEEPSTKNALSVVKAPDGYRWEALRARANENLKLVFIAADAGRSLQTLRVERGREALLARCQFHHASGLLSVLAGQLKALRAPVRLGGRDRIGTHVLIEVQGHGDSQTGLWFLEVDAGGTVVDALDRN